MTTADVENLFRRWEKTFADTEVRVACIRGRSAEEVAGIRERSQKAMEDHAAKMLILRANADREIAEIQEKGKTERYQIGRSTDVVCAELHRTAAIVLGPALALFSVAWLWSLWAGS